MGSGVRFLLDGELRELGSVDPTLTVLEYVRGAERRCGTKEGCAEGDCGACTVVLGELREGAPRLRAVNACLLFVPALDGKALFTVESLRRPDGALHPVQRALVEQHGSQCGFCTPGFVMSMFALFEGGAAPSRARIVEALAGNLCRCTGYLPIVAALRRACEDAADQRGAALRGLAERLRGIARTGTLAVEQGGRRFLAPRTLDEAAALYELHPDAHLLAGGTDLGVTVTKGHRRLDTVLYLAELPELRSVTAGAGGLEIGAAVPYADLLDAFSAHHPDLGALVRRIGSEQIRNVGTLGGNLGTASPIGDAIPALMALDATLVLRQGSARREVAVADFFGGYRQTVLRRGELIERVRVPAIGRGRHFRAYKVAKRVDQDISAVCGAFAIALDGGRAGDVRVCYGGMAATPRRARACEDALRGRPFTAATVAAALPALDADLTPMSDMRASAAYRRLVARNLLVKFHREVAGTPGATRLLAPAEDA